MKRQPVQPAGVPTFIGIDYHKAYSVYCVLDAQGSNLERGRIDHARPEDFRALVRRWAGCRVVFEASMNWRTITRQRLQDRVGCKTQIGAGSSR